MFLYVETFFERLRQRYRWRTHVLNFLSNTNTAVATADPVRKDGHDNTAANRLHITRIKLCAGQNYFLPRSTAVDTKSNPGSDVRNSCLLSITNHGQPNPNPPVPNVCDVLYYPSSFHYVTLRYAIS